MKNKKYLLIKTMIFLAFISTNQILVAKDINANFPTRLFTPDGLNKLTENIKEHWRSSNSQKLIVLFNKDFINPSLISGYNLKKTVIERNKLHYDAIKNVFSKSFAKAKQISLEQNFRNFPMQLYTVKSIQALAKLANNKYVLAIYSDRKLQHHLLQSLPLIQQPKATSMGITGKGTSVVILDTGLNYTLPEFGNCTAPTVPATCRVITVFDVAPDDAALDSSGHGTQVSAVVASTSTSTKLIGIDVFDGSSASISSILTSLDWAILNQATYNISSINMSLGDGGQYSTPCASVATNPFIQPFSDVRANGMLPVVSTGNNAYSNGISLPACTPGAISVGAVNDANIGAITYSSCTDSITSPDTVACYSNSVDYQSLLAPGTYITTSAFDSTGTSFSAPFVSAAIATLRSAYANETVAQIEKRIVTSRTLITDPKNSISKPRLDILAAIGSINNNFSDRKIISSNSGQISGINTNASKEIGEPNHAGNTGGASIWWSWQATETGFITITTDNSDFDTVIAVYAGSSLAQLIEIGSDDNSGTTTGSSQITVYVEAGAIYQIAVDGVGGATGEINLRWNVTTTGISEDIPFIPIWALVLLVSGLGFVIAKKNPYEI